MYCVGIYGFVYLIGMLLGLIVAGFTFAQFTYDKSKDPQMAVFLIGATVAGVLSWITVIAFIVDESGILRRSR